MGREPEGHEGEGVSGGRAYARERAWFVASLVLLGAAGVMLPLGYVNAAFVAAALGASAWFYDLRAGLKRKHDLVKLSGRNWMPRGEVEEDESDEGDEV